jgi:hypothetical protein
MALKKNNNSEGHFKSVMMAAIILLLHVLLLFCLGLLVVFFNGVVTYLPWIFLVGSAIIFIAVYIFYKRMKKQGKTLHEMIRTPLLNGRPVEVSLLGGLISFKVGRPGNVNAIAHDASDLSNQLEDPASVRIRELNELARLLEDGLITLDEFNQTKKNLFA